MQITSTSNERVKALRRLHRVRGRRETGLTLLEGPNVVTAALASGVELREVWATDDSGDIRCSDAVLAAISTTDSPQSPVAVLAVPEPEPLQQTNTVVIWELSDPGNVGTIIRTAAALGWGVAVTSGTADPWAPKVLRAGAGAHFATRISHIASLRDLTGFTTVATVVAGGAPLDTARADPIALLVGNEGRGLAGDVTAAADVRVTIPIQAGVESLNASVAAAIAMWELGRGT